MTQCKESNRLDNEQLVEDGLKVITKVSLVCIFWSVTRKPEHVVPIISVSITLCKSCVPDFFVDYLQIREYIATERQNAEAKGDTVQKLSLEGLSMRDRILLQSRADGVPVILIGHS